MSPRDLSWLTAQRAAAYGLLARLFRIEVDDACLDGLKALRFPAQTGNALVDEGYQLLASYLQSVWENSIIELAVDYARVFIGNGMDGFSAAYPYESVYTSEKRLLMQDARDEVLAIYRSAGLEKGASWKDGEDHIALELEFEQVLCCRLAKALEEGDSKRAGELLCTQRNFLVDHLVSWVPGMTAEMKRFAHTGLYRGLASLTEGFLEADLVFLNEVIAEER
jgi:TorA maturation chaperone TorD